MARQAGPIFITGTIDDVVFYQLGGKYYMRRKGEPTPITKKRMSQQEHYPVLYLRKQEFKRAAQMVREWYYTLPREVRRHGLFGQLTGRAVRWLRQGKTEEEIRTLLWQELGLAEAPVEQPVPVKGEATDTAAKPVLKPTRRTSKEKRKGKRAVVSPLSCWQVSEQGQLHKEGVKGKAIDTKRGDGAGLYVGYYSSWTSSGW